MKKYDGAVAVERLTVSLDTELADAVRRVLERDNDVLTELAGTLTSVYADGELDALRDEWA
ncbi:hypothetical protein [Candidatus Poriferisocius sp.]|uniref:hypothetical protein n=1 Tax=Candidatus Poriferisocius sp. TaxID=3101276 RepID=UPI003B5ACD7E